MQGTSRQAYAFMREFNSHFEVVHLGLFTAIACLVLISISHAQELYKRSLQIGNTPEIQEKAQTQPDPYSMTALLSNFEVAKVGMPPPACGLNIARYYRNKLVEDFSVTALNTCEESQISVDCSSEFLDDTSNTFIKLIYVYKPSKEMKLELLFLSQSDLGEVGEIKVPREIKFKLAKMWDDLTEIVRCNIEEK